MATHVMKIRPHFIQSIRNGAKKHEYRLADDARKAIKPGDVLLLVSNQNPSDYVRVFVNSVETFADWEEALSKNWESDFQGVYSDYSDLIRECHRFYSSDQVKRYGIIVFGIVPEDIRYENARYLLDTNIVIHRESQDEALPIAGKLYHWIDSLGGKKLFHPSLRTELAKHKDKNVAQSMTDKLNAYDEVVPSTKKDPFFSYGVGNALDENSKIDDEMLLQVYSGRTDFLITEDKGILRKAEKLYLRGRVMTIEEFVHLMEKANPSLTDYEVLSIKKDKIGTLEVSDPFFDSLREDYGYTDFDAWLNRKSGEEAYIFKDREGALQGFLYLKKEGEEEPFKGFDKPMKRQSWLKVGTFKSASKGLHVGERFLKIIFDNALSFDVDGIYVTLFEDKRDGVKALMGLMTKWGFVPYCHKDNGELVLVKDMRNYDPDKGPMFNFPLTKPGCSYGFLPIEPEWHGKLFPDLHLRNEDMSLYEKEPCSYATEKIYVCGWRDLKAKPGDLVFIYRKGEGWPKKYHSVVSGLAIIEEILYPRSEEEYLGLVKNKSVFTEDELKSFYRESKYRTVVKLLFLKPFRNKITLKGLYDLGIFDEASNEAPRMSTIITAEQARSIIEKGERQ